MPRTKCLFKNCNCQYYHGKKSNICRYCNHGKVWHKKEKTSTNISQFISPRLPADKPYYIFYPNCPPLIEVVAEPIYCVDVIELPV